MKATDFNMQKDLKFNLNTGITTFKDSRVVILDANALGLLRQRVIEAIGMTNAKKLFFKLGFQNGYTDFMQIKVNYEFDDEKELLASGPVIHTWEGEVQASPLEIDYNRDTGHFFFTGIWSNSWEAEQHLMHNKKSDEPVCWQLSGYASGWCSAFFGKPTLCLEPVCVGKGDNHCEWKIQNLDAWGPEADDYKDAIQEFVDKMG